MKANIIKRIEAIEKKIMQIEIPDFVMVHYDWNSHDWVVREDYFKTDAKGNVMKGYSKPSKTMHMQHYKEYIIHPQFIGTILLELRDCPDEYEAGLFSMKMNEFRKENNLENCGISLEVAMNDKNDSLEKSFNVVVVRYS